MNETLDSGLRWNDLLDYYAAPNKRRGAIYRARIMFCSSVDFLSTS